MGKGLRRWISHIRESVGRMEIINSSMRSCKKILKNHMKNHYPFFIFLVVWLLVGLSYMDKSVCSASDQAIYMLMARDISEDFDLDFSPRTLYSDFNQSVRVYHGNPPLIPFFLGILFHVFGFSEYFAKILMLFVSLFAIIALYVLATSLYDRRIGLISSFFFGISPVFLNFGLGKILFDVPSILFINLTILSIILSIRRESPLLFLISGFIMGLAFLCKYPVVVLYLTVFLIILTQNLPKKKKFLFMAIVFFSSTIPMIPWFLYNVGIYGNPLGSFLDDSYSHVPFLQYGSPYSNVQNRSASSSVNLDMSENQLNGLLRLFNPGNFLIYYLYDAFDLGIGLVVLALCGLFFIKLDSFSDRVILISLLSFLIVFHITQRYSLGRYMIPTLPFISILAAIALNKLAEFRFNLSAFKFHHVFLLILLFMPFISVYESIEMLNRMERHSTHSGKFCNFYKEIGSEVRKLTDVKDVIWSPNARYLTYYSERRTVSLGSLEIDKDTIYRYNISYAEIPHLPKYYLELKYLALSPEFRVFREIDIDGKRVCLFEIEDIEEGIYCDKDTGITTEFSDDKFLVYDRDGKLLYTGEKSLDKSRGSNLSLIIRIDDIDAKSSVYSLGEISKLCRIAGCRVIYSLRPSLIQCNNKTIEFLKDEVKNGNFVFIQGDGYNFKDSGYGAQYHKITHIKSQFEGIGIYPKGFTSNKNFDNNTMDAVSNSGLNYFSAHYGDYSHMDIVTFNKVLDYDYVYSYNITQIKNLIRNETVVLTIRSDTLRYMWYKKLENLKSFIASIKFDLDPIPDIRYSDDCKS